MNDEIRNWLLSKNKDYDAGVQLFIKHGGKRPLINFFLRKESPHSREKLEYELGKLVNSMPKTETKTVVRKGRGTGKTQAQQVQQAAKPHVNTEPQTNNDCPTKEEILASLNKQKTAVFNKKAMLSNQLVNASTKERKELIKEINAYREELKTLSKKIAHVEANGSLPENPITEDKPLPEDKAELMRMLTNARARRSKAQKTIETSGKKSPQGKKAVAKFNEEDKLIKELEAKLN